MIKTILITLGILALIEGLAIALMSKSAKKSLINLIKSRNFRILGITEVIIALIVIIGGLFL